ncbi:MAG: hypothetical protein ABSD85_09850 [Acidimicrobiales bacterium]|jgi:hypothetical protein
MNDTQQLRTAVIGLIALAGAEEQMLLGELGACGAEQGTAQMWAGLPIVAHDTEFKHQQVQRLEAVRKSEPPPDFPETDHRSADAYRHYAEQSAAAVAQASDLTTRALIDEVLSACDEDLLDHSRHPWLAGRQLWLQVVVRGFWHPMGHLGEYYLAHARPDRAVDLQGRAVALADLLSAPEPVQGMASYNLACAQARAKRPAAALETLGLAIRLNPQLRDNARRDADLEVLRENGRLEALVC